MFFKCLNLQYNLPNIWSMCAPIKAGNPNRIYLSRGVWELEKKWEILLSVNLSNRFRRSQDIPDTNTVNRRLYGTSVIAISA